MVIGIVVISLLVVCMVLLCSNIYINGSAAVNLHTQTVDIKVYFYRICLFKRSIDLMNEETDEKHSLQDILSMIHKTSHDLPRKVSDFNEAATIILSRLRFKKWYWHTHIGTGEAHTTGIAGGGLWGAKGTIVGLIASKSQFQCEPSLAVTPSFNQKQLNSVADCMIAIRLGQAIYALLKIIWKLPARRQAAI
ncbi:hypothetical protein GCM10028778_24810 [Barrientosiimonas marina]